MFILVLFQWWYSVGWLERFTKIGHQLSLVSESFSIGILLKTLFKPWKQVSTLRVDQNNFFRKMLDGFVSRFVGFWVRFFVLIAGTVYLLISFTLMTMLAIIWPVIPLLPVVFVLISAGVLG